MLDKDNVFGDFSEKDLIKGIISIVDAKVTKSSHYKKIIINRNDIPVYSDIRPDVFGNFNATDFTKGIDEIVCCVLKQYLIIFYKSKIIEPLFFGNFDENDLYNGIIKLTDIRLSESLSYHEYQNQPLKINQTIYNSTNANQYVYILYNEILYQEYNTHIYKIGWTSRTPSIRAEEISQGTGVVGKWKVGHQWKVEDGYWLEQEIFKHFSKYRLPYSEQFNFKGQTLEQVAEQISRFINNHGESPKRTAEIAAKEYEERERKKKLEAEHQRVKYVYDSECNKIKIEIQNIQHSNLEKALKNNKELKEYFYICMFISSSIGVGMGLYNGNNFLGWIIICLIIGWVFYFFEKDSKYHECKNKHLTPLPDDLEQLKKIRNEIMSIKV